MLRTIQQHWPEYLMEAAGLGIFMIAACGFATLLFYPSSEPHDGLLRQVIMGIAMGLTAIAIIYSPWGKQSGAHINPAVTLTFLRLGKIALYDALAYIVAQCIGASLGVGISALVLGHAIADPAVNYVVTQPGDPGVAAAFLAEIVISFGLMFMVLNVSNTPRLARYTGVFSGLLVMSYIVIEAPLSGMSMNPARSLGSAIFAHAWNNLWIYFTAPLIGMLTAAQLYIWRRGRHTVRCAKLYHAVNKRCIFVDCHYRSYSLDNGEHDHE